MKLFLFPLVPFHFIHRCYYDYYYCSQNPAACFIFTSSISVDQTVTSLSRLESRVPVVDSGAAARGRIGRPESWTSFLPETPSSHSFLRGKTHVSSPIRFVFSIEPFESQSETVETGKNQHPGQFAPTVFGSLHNHSHRTRRPTLVHD